MLMTIFGIFLILHGLVHIWYVVLSFNIVTYQPDIGWTGKSWLLSPLLSEHALKSITGVLFIIATLLFIISGIGILTSTDNIKTILKIAAIFSTAVLILFWDGHFTLLVKRELSALC